MRNGGKNERVAFIILVSVSDNFKSKMTDNLSEMQIQIIHSFNTEM